MVTTAALWIILGIILWLAGLICVVVYSLLGDVYRAAFGMTIGVGIYMLVTICLLVGVGISHLATWINH